VVNDKVYLSGVAKDKSEMLRVKDHAVSARFVKEVYNYIILDSDVR
jgi:osmotically-inducible protein OsmY